MSTRRTFLGQGMLGLGALALHSLLAKDARADERASGPARFPAKAKRVLFLHMAGAPSHLDLFDPKPALKQLDGQPVPDSFIKGERFARPA